MPLCTYSKTTCLGIAKRKTNFGEIYAIAVTLATDAALSLLQQQLGTASAASSRSGQCYA